MNIRINENIKRLRKEKGINQETLAQEFGISIQAISKWETGNAFPDLLLLPNIAQYFGVTIDYLFYGEETTINEIILSNDKILDDDTIRVIQCIGKKIVKQEEYDESRPFILDVSSIGQEFNVEVWGKANIQGDIKGRLDANGGVNCGNIGGHVDASGGVNCGNIGGYVDASGDVICGNVGGYVDASGDVTCGDVGGYVDASGSVICGNINAYLDTTGDVHCGNIAGNIENANNIYCQDLECNDIECESIIVEKNVNCNCIEGKVIYKGELNCKSIED